MEFRKYIPENNRFGKSFPSEIMPSLLVLQQAMVQAGLPILIGETDSPSHITIGFPESSQNRKTTEKVLSAVMESDAWNSVRQLEELMKKQKALNFLIRQRRRQDMYEKPFQLQRSYLGSKPPEVQLNQERLREIIKKAMETREI